MENKANQVNKEIAIECLKSMLDWSDRIGSDEIAEIEFVIDMLTRKDSLIENIEKKVNEKISSSVSLNEKNKIMEEIIDRERVINQIQKINCMGRNNITELANLQNDELVIRLNELIKYKK